MLRLEEGAALVTALMLTMLSLVIAMALLSTVLMGTRMSAGQKRYRSSLAAAQGGVELVTREILPALLQPDPLNTVQTNLTDGFSAINLQLPQYSCLQQKLHNPTNMWSAACNDSSDPTLAPDVIFTLGGGSEENGFSVSAKIVDSVPGNSETGGNDLLDPGLSAAGLDEVIHPQHVPGIYHLSVQGAREGGNDREKARLSVLYAY